MIITLADTSATQSISVHTTGSKDIQLVGKLAAICDILINTLDCAIRKQRVVIDDVIVQDGIILGDGIYSVSLKQEMIFFEVSLSFL